MAASAIHKFLLEFSSSKENTDPSLDTWSGEYWSLIFESHKEILILVIAAQASLWNVRL